MPAQKTARKTATKSRAAINKENARHSTGPKTEEGKEKSSQNSFKHGLYSKHLVVPGEDPAELDELRAKLRTEYQPVNTTEEILVDELAQHYWRIRRIRNQENVMWERAFEGPIAFRTIEAFGRALASAERSFHKTLAALQKLQKARGFVPQKTQPVAAPLSQEAIQQVLSCLFPEDNAPQKPKAGFDFSLFPDFDFDIPNPLALP